MFMSLQIVGTSLLEEFVNNPELSRSCRASFKNLGQKSGTKSGTKIWDKQTDGQTRPDIELLCN